MNSSLQTGLCFTKFHQNCYWWSINKTFLELWILVKVKIKVKAVKRRLMFIFSFRIALEECFEDVFSRWLVTLCRVVLTVEGVDCQCVYCKCKNLLEIKVCQVLLMFICLKTGDTVGLCWQLSDFSSKNWTGDAKCTQSFTLQCLWAWLTMG